MHLLEQEEAKEAFKELLVATNVASDWTWENTMRKIIADPRWGCVLESSCQGWNAYLNAINAPYVDLLQHR